LNKLYAHVETTSNFPVPPPPPSSSCVPSPVESREAELRDRPHKSQKRRKKGVVDSLRSSRRHTDMGEATEGRFKCDACDICYEQIQGLNRHLRKKHDPDLCMYCDFEWSRPYEYRAHLTKHHIGIDPDIVLGKAAGSRCRSAVMARRRPQRQASPPVDLAP